MCHFTRKFRVRNQTNIPRASDFESRYFLKQKNVPTSGNTRRLVAQEQPGIGSHEILNGIVHSDGYRGSSWREGDQPGGRRFISRRPSPRAEINSA